MTPWLRRVAAGLVAGAAIGLTVVMIGTAAYTVSRGELLAVLDENSLFQIVLIGLPFVMLGLIGTTARRPWITALLMTTAIQGFILYETLKPYEGGGANIGLGLLALFSPVIVGGAALFAALNWRRDDPATLHRDPATGKG